MNFKKGMCMPSTGWCHRKFSKNYFYRISREKTSILLAPRQPHQAQVPSDNNIQQKSQRSPRLATNQNVSDVRLKPCLIFVRSFHFTLFCYFRSNFHRLVFHHLCRYYKSYTMLETLPLLMLYYYLSGNRSAFFQGSSFSRQSLRG